MSAETNTPSQSSTSSAGKVPNLRVKETDEGAFRMGGRTWALILLLAVAIFGAFGPAMRASFVDFDDGLYVFRNQNVLNGLSGQGIKWAFTSREAGYWVPMVWLSLQLDATLSAVISGVHATAASPTDALPNAVVYHIDNIVLHTIAASILFLFLYRATRRRGASFAAALLWAVHPLRVESVAWITERKDVLAGAFGFLAMYLYVTARQRGSRVLFWASCGTFVLSLWSKAIFVTLPALLILVDYWPLGYIGTWKEFRRALMNKWALFIAAALSAAATLIMGLHFSGTLHIGFPAMAANALLSYGRYMVMQAGFGSLAPYYPYARPDPLLVGVSIASLVILTGWALWQRRGRPWILMGWLWYLAAFLPNIGFIQCFTQGYADRFTYLPTVGLFIMAAFSVPAARHLQRPMRITLGIAGGVLAVVFIVFTARQAAYWKDSNTLFEHSQSITGPSPLVQTALGEVYIRTGRYNEAVEKYQQVIAANPEAVEKTYTKLAYTYYLMKRYDLGISAAKLAVQVNANYAEAHNDLGTLYDMEDRLEEAAAEYEIALRLNPRDVITQRNLQLAQDRIKKRGPATGIRP
jgi:tetratricopeptide (TPR) repeat protein